MKPKILFVLPDLAAGGAHSMNVRLAQQLRRRGWTVGLVVLFRREEVIGPDALAGLDVHRLDATGLGSKLSALVRLGRLARCYDLVVGGMEFAATNYGFFAARLAGNPFLSWTHTSLTLHQTSAGAGDRIVSKWVYQHCREIILPSHGALESLRLAVGTTPKGACWQVIENFIEIPQITEREEAPNSSVFAKPVVIGIGRLVSVKAFCRLIRAHATLRAEGIDHHLLILGEGPLRSELEVQARALGVAQTVFMPGHVANVQDWLVRSTVFVLCSHYEGFPLVLLEALSCGVPAVAMDCVAGPREILQDGRFGMLVPDGDEAALTEGVGRLLRNQALRAHYAELGRQRALDYSAERIVPQWEALLEEIVIHRRKANNG